MASPAPPRSRFSAKFSRASGEEAPPGHAVEVDGPAAALLADHAADVPQQVPEGGGVAHRPGMQGAIVRQGELVALLGLAAEGGHLAATLSGEGDHRGVSIGSGMARSDGMGLMES